MNLEMRPAARREMSAARRRAIGAVAVFVVLLGGVLGKIMLDPDGVGIVAWDPSSVATEAETFTTTDGGSYAYLATQPNSSDPVTYDPCETIEVVLNLRTGPDDAEQIVAAALREVADRTGLKFSIVGKSSEPVSDSWLTDADADRPPPVLIAWTDPAEVKDLDGAVAGLGGSATAERNGQVRYLTGRVLLDGPQLRQLGDETTRAVVRHELAHLVGLAHVASSDELMAPTGGRTEWGSGDLAGLAQVGAGGCR